MAPHFISALALILMLCLFDPAHSFSACDDVDVLFVIDTASIKHASDNVLSFIDSIVMDGSSEDAGFSVVLYGDVPVDMDIRVVSLDETQCIHRRESLEAAFIANLTSAFDAVRVSNETRHVDVLDAFASSTTQHKPQRRHYKRSALASDSYSLGAQDDENEIFVFDFFNVLLPLDDQVTDPTHLYGDAPTYNNGSDVLTPLCALLDHDATHDDETLHFMLGQQMDKLDIVCDDAFPMNLFHNTFFTFGDDLLTSASEMERVFDITCPAVIDTPEFDGKVNLGNHVQWLEADTVMECELTLLSDDVDRPVAITNDSYMLIRDVLDDDDVNTFKIGDYLMASPNVTASIDALGCWSSVYLIKDIEDVGADGNAMIRRLYVHIPDSPIEYIFSTNVHAGKVPVTQSEIKQSDSSGRALLGWLVLTNEGSIDLGDAFGDFFSYTYEKTFEGGQDVSFGSKPEFAFSGSGSLTLSAGYDFDLDLSLDFAFEWDVLSDDIYFYFTLNVDYGLTLHIGAELVGQVEAAINDLINIGKVLTFSIGPVPVIIKPFVSLSASITSVPLRMYGGVECHYGETITTGYRYKKDTVFHAQYGLIRSNTRYTLGIRNTWNDIAELDTCVRLNYEEGAGAGLTCVWFDYNEGSQRCRCYGAGVMWGDTTSESGTNAYIINKKCNGLYRNKCDICWGDIYVKDDGTSGCFLGIAHSWYCIACPLFQSNSGYAEVTYPYAGNEHINERTEHDNNGCSPVIELKAEDEDGESCPALQFGFDIEVSLKVGCNFYSLVTVYGRAALEIPFRINVPEMDNAICAGAADSCGSDDLVVSSTIAIDLSFYIGVEVDFSTLGDIVSQIESSSGGLVDPNVGAAMLIATVEILPVTPISCDSFNEAFSFLGDTVRSVLDDFVRGKCCDEEDLMLPTPAPASDPAQEDDDVSVEEGITIGWRDVSAADVSITTYGVTAETAQDDQGRLTIEGTVQSGHTGCGDPPASHMAVFIDDAAFENPWERVQYTIEFEGASSCFSLFGNTKYGDWSESGITTLGVLEDHVEIIENGLVYGDFDGESWRCDNEQDNFLHSTHGKLGVDKGYLRVEQSRDPSANEAAIGFGLSCTVVGTKVRFSDIQIEYSVPTTTEEPMTTSAELTYTAIGPYKDASSRAMRYGPYEGFHTADECYAACSAYQYFALQAGRQCFCDDDWSRVTMYGAADCGETGGGWCNFVYKNERWTPVYFRGPSVMVQPAAEAYCQENGGHLASIHSETQLSAAAAECAGSSGRICWIGLESEGGSLDWSWMDGSALDFGFNSDGTPTTGISPWGEGEPNDDGFVEDCADIRDARFNDARCDAEFYPLCEKDNDVETEEPTTTEDLMSWQLAINLNPCDGHDFGYYSGWWDSGESLGSDETAFTHDYVDSETMRVPVSYITIARHDGERCEMSKTWKLQSDSRSLHDYFADPDGRIYATGDGSVDDTHISSDMPSGSFAGETTDPIFGADGGLVLNWVYSNNGARIAVPGGYKIPYTLPGADENNDDLHGLGNEFGAKAYPGSSAWRHDAAMLSGDCHGGSCPMVGTDHGTALSDGECLGSYAIFVSQSPEEFECREHYWIVDGGESWVEDEFSDECTPAMSTNSLTTNRLSTTDIAVQCCDADGTKAYREDVGCLKGVSFYEAEQACEDAGYRLCTREEVQSDIGAGRGCQFDGFHVWTSTPCEETTNAAAAKRIRSHTAVQSQQTQHFGRAKDTGSYAVGARPNGAEEGADTPKDTVIAVEVSKYGLEVFAFALMALCAMACVAWRITVCCRHRPAYSKVGYVSDTEADTEENAAINDGDEQL